MRFPMKIWSIPLAACSAATALAGAPATGSFTYTLQKAANPTPDQLDAYARIQAAMDSALGYYNTLTTLGEALVVQYDSTVPTADASFTGPVRFGSDRTYMYVGTAMHEMAHTLGSGTTPEYEALAINGIFTGTRATATLRAITGDPTAVLQCDTQHFWPYGLNYKSEVTSDTVLVDHCKIVQSLVQDLFHDSTVFQGRIQSKATGQCMDRSGSSLTLGPCSDTGSRIRLVATGDTGIVYRVEFGNLVLDAPGQSTAAGLQMGLYTLNRGTNQEMRIEGGSPVPGVSLQFRMVHSSLLLEAVGTGVVQNPTKASSLAQAWELVDSETTALQPREGANPLRTGPPVDILGRTLLAPPKPWLGWSH